MQPKQQHQQNSPLIHYDVIIIGQGLAGSLLAWELIQRGKRIMVIDNQHKGASSQVAAGIINPVTGHRINITHEFHHFLDIAKSSYDKLQKQFGISFIDEVKQLRLIKNQGQYDYYSKRLQEPTYCDLINTPMNQHHSYKLASFGIGEINQTFRVDAKKLLLCIQQFLQDKQALLKQRVDYADIHFKSNTIEINSNNPFKTDYLICCEGFQAIHNPWFKNLPFKLAKGEILTVALDQENHNMLNWGNWLLPTGTRTAYLGSSYHWKDLSLSTNNEVADTLLSNLHEKTTLSASILDHQAGIRPTTHERKQLIGQHPKQPRLYCFNGFGSKGCLTIPHYAKQLTKHICSQTPLAKLMPELDQTLGL